MFLRARRDPALDQRPEFSPERFLEDRIRFGRIEIGRQEFKQLAIAVLYDGFIGEHLALLW